MSLSIVKRWLLPILGLLCLLGPIRSCKHRGSDHHLSSDFRRDTVDTLILSNALVDSPDQCRIDGINLFMDALNEGLLRNGAMTGLGTDYPLGKKLKTDSLYFQGLRILSIFDWEVSTRLRNREISCLPEEASLQLASVQRNFIRGLRQPFPDDVKKLQKAAAKVSPELSDFEVVAWDRKEDLKAWPDASSLSDPQQMAIYLGAKDKLQFAQLASTQSRDEATKLRGFIAAVSPITASFHSQAPSSSTPAKFYTEAYIPAFHELNVQNLDRVATWTLTPGIKRRRFSRPIQISVASLTHFRYLSEPDAETLPLIKLQIFKDMETPDRLLTRVLFGHLALNGAVTGDLPMNISDYRDSLVVEFFPNITPKDRDSTLIKGLKEQFNEIGDNVMVEARIHQLTLSLERPPLPSISSAKDLMLKPHFSLKDSDISFRLHRKTSESVEAASMQRVGFTCVPTGKSSEKDCYQDFGAYTNLRDFVLKGDRGLAEGRLSTVLADKFKSLLNSVTRYNVKFIVDWNLPEIEEALDQEFAAIIAEFLDEQIKNRDVIRERLDSRLLRAP